MPYPEVPDPIPPIELDVVCVESVGIGIGNEAIPVALRLRDYSVIVLQCRGGHFFPNKRHRVHFDKYERVYQTEIIGYVQSPSS